MVDGPRQRLLISAIALMCERGVHATGLADLLADSKTARGSLYQHFPGGKAELMVAATEVAGQAMTSLFEELLGTRSPADAIGGVVEHWKRVLVDSGYAKGCPVLAAAQAATEPEVQAASAAVFTAWVDTIAAALGREGVEPGRARALAGLVVSSIEGGIAQSRSVKSTRPLDDVHTVLTGLIGSAGRCLSSPSGKDRETGGAFV